MGGTEEVRVSYLTLRANSVSTLKHKETWMQTFHLKHTQVCHLTSLFDSHTLNRSQMPSFTNVNVSSIATIISKTYLLMMNLFICSPLNNVQEMQSLSAKH